MHPIYHLNSAGKEKLIYYVESEIILTIKNDYFTKKEYININAVDNMWDMFKYFIRKENEIPEIEKCDGFEAHRDNFTLYYDIIFEMTMRNKYLLEKTSQLI